MIPPPTRTRLRLHNLIRPKLWLRRSFGSPPPPPHLFPQRTMWCHWSSPDASTPLLPTLAHPRGSVAMPPMRSSATRAARSSHTHLLASSPLLRLGLFLLVAASTRAFRDAAFRLLRASRTMERLRHTCFRRPVCHLPSRRRLAIHRLIHHRRHLRHHLRHHRRGPSSMLIRHHLNLHHRVRRRHRRRSCRRPPFASHTTDTAGSWRMGRAT